MRFLHNLRRKKKQYTALLSYVAPNTEPLFFERKIGVDIDALKNEQRLYILGIAYKILSLDSFSFLSHLEKSFITRNTLRSTIGSPSSVSMQKIMDELPPNNRKLRHPPRTKEIEPLSAKEVERLMDEIRQYL
jgi:hypothetical protein